MFHLLMNNEFFISKADSKVIANDRMTLCWDHFMKKKARQELDAQKIYLGPKFSIR